MLRCIINGKFRSVVGKKMKIFSQVAAGTFVFAFFLQSLCGSFLNIWPALALLIPQRDDSSSLFVMQGRCLFIQIVPYSFLCPIWECCCINLISTRPSTVCDYYSPSTTWHSWSAVWMYILATKLDLFSKRLYEAEVIVLKICQRVRCSRKEYYIRGRECSNFIAIDERSSRVCLYAETIQLTSSSTNWPCSCCGLAFDLC